MEAAMSRLTNCSRMMDGSTIYNVFDNYNNITIEVHMESTLQ